MITLYLDAAEYYRFTPQLDGRIKVECGAPNELPTARRSPLLNLREVAARLGCAENTVRNYVANRGLPHVRIGSAIRVDPEQLEQWIKKGYGHCVGGAL